MLEVENLCFSVEIFHTFTFFLSENQQEIVKGNDYQYKFKVVEIFEKIVSFFE